MKRFLALLAALLFALPACAGTNMLTAAGVTAPATSTCPATGTSTCASGWFSIRGAATVVIHVWQSAGTGTVLLQQRLDAADGAWTLNTWTNPTATQIAYVVAAPAGDIQISVTAVSGGTVKAKIEATSRSGGKIW